MFIKFLIKAQVDRNYKILLQKEFRPIVYRYERKVDVVINVLITGKFACYVKQKQTTENPQNFNFLRP